MSDWADPVMVSEGWKINRIFYTESEQEHKTYKMSDWADPVMVSEGWKINRIFYTESEQEHKNIQDVWLGWPGNGAWRLKN